MLHFSFSTVLMAFLASITVSVLTALLFSNKTTMICTGYKILMAFVGIAFVRMLFPFEFPFTVRILLPQSLSGAVFFFRQSWIPVMGSYLSLWNLFEIVWISGIIVKLLCYIVSYRRTKNYIAKYGQDKTSNIRYKAILDKICRQHHRDNLFRVVELPGLSVPVILGRKNPCILLPAQLSVSSDKLYYILCHEALHHFHHSFLAKSVLRALSIIYWWNPACIVLNRCSNTLLEMHIDDMLTQKDAEVTEQYTACLVYMKREALKHSSRMPSFLQKDSLSFVRTKNSDLKKRILLLLRSTKTWKKIVANISLMIFTLCISAASYLFILEADYNPPYFNENFSVPTTENAYFIINTASSYDLYINHVYIETVTDLEYYPTGIKIYDKEGVLIYENE